MYGPIPIALLASGGAVSVDVDATVIVQFVLFACFVVIMKPLIFDPLIRVFEERERRTAGAVVAARQLDERAIELKHEVEQRLDGVRREATAHRDRLRHETSKLESEQLAQARREANARIERGKAAVAGEVTRIRQELERQRQALAAEIATRVLGREVKP